MASAAQHYLEAEALAELANSPAGAAMASDGIDLAGVARVHAELATAGAILLAGQPHGSPAKQALLQAVAE